MVHPLEPHRLSFFRDRLLARRKSPVVVVPLDESVNRIAISPNRRTLDGPVLVLQNLRRLDTLRPAFHRLLESPLRILHPHSNIRHAIPVGDHEAGDGMVRHEGRGDQEPHIALLEQVRGLVPDPRLRTTVSYWREAEAVLAR